MVPLEDRVNGRGFSAMGLWRGWTGDGRSSRGWCGVAAIVEATGLVLLSSGKVCGAVLWKPQSFFW